jgi:hypothetical protein
MNKHIYARTSSIIAGYIYINYPIKRLD